MAFGSGGASQQGARTEIRVVVAGDRATGKSSLIVAAATGVFPTDVPSVLPPTKLRLDADSEGVPIIIIDTSSSSENRDKLSDELTRADVVILTYACDQPATLDRLSTFWLPELNRLEVKVPIIVVGCKLDLRDEERQVTLEDVMTPIMQQYREIETCVECSAVKQIQVSEVFFYAQKAVIHPTGPLFDQEGQTLKRRCISALKRVFILCDHDKDGALSEKELNDFQVECFNTPLQPSEISAVKKVVRDKLPSGVNDRGLTLHGFLYLHALFVEKGRPETIWTVLRKFGYNNDIRLQDTLFPSPIKRYPDQSVELSNNAVEFLKQHFDLYAEKNTGFLHATELDELFSTAPESPWNEVPYQDATEKSNIDNEDAGDLSLDAFLSEWALMTRLNPKSTLEYLKYIGYEGDPSSAIHVTRRRRTDRKKKQTERSVFQCFVFGPKKSGKSALLDTFLRRSFNGGYTPSYGDRYAINVVGTHEGHKKTLILREIPECQVGDVLSDRESLAACDIAIFMYDSSDEASWNRTGQLLLQVTNHGEYSGFEVPCLIISAKDDLDSYPNAIQNSTRVTQDMGMQAPIPVSVKLGDINNLFDRIVTAAETPHLSIPETEAGRSRKQFHKLVNRSLLFASVAAAVAGVGIIAYRVYHARKTAS